MCLLCNTEDETIEHFLLRCPALQQQRKDTIKDIEESVQLIKNAHNIKDVEISMVQVIIDSTALKLKMKTNQKDNLMLRRLEFHTRRLCFKLHTERYKQLCLKNKT